MKSGLFLTKVALFFVALTSLHAQTASVTKGCIPLTVDFFAPPGHPSWYWDFKNSGTSIQENPSRAFGTPGTYLVEFRETAGGPLIGTVEIQVYSVPVIDINYTSPSCTGYAIPFSGTVTKDPSINITGYNWAFGDGAGATGSPNVGHVYSASGTYDLSLALVTDKQNCSITATYPGVIEVKEAPVASFTTNPSNLSTCNNTLNNVAFTSTSTGVQALTYAWDFGNGNTSTAQTPPAQNYTGPGTFTAIHTVSYAGLTGCTSTANANVRLGKPNPDLIQQDQKVCAGNPTNFRTTTPGTYSWSFGADATPTTSTAASVNVSFANAGNHIIVLNVTSPDGLCSSKKLTTISVDKVDATFTSAPNFSCETPTTITYQATSNQSNVQYKWIFAANGVVDSVTGKDISTVYRSKTDSIYYSKNWYEPLPTTLVVTSLSSGCKATFTKIDTMWLPNARFAVNSFHGCAPLTVNFSDSSYSFNKIVQWKWLYDDGGATQTNATRAGVTHVYNTPGVYYPRLVVTTQSGCIDTSYAIQIEVGTTVSADFTASPTDICIGQSVQLNTVISPANAALVDAYHFYGEGNRISHCGADDNVNWVYDDTVGLLPVQLQLDYNGCLTTITKNNFINVKGAMAKIHYTGLCATPLQYNFESRSVNATNITWKFYDDNTTSNASTVTHNYSASGNELVELTAENPASGCAADVETRVVKVRQIKAEFKRDTLLCIDKPYPFDASASVDVDVDCYSGYLWEFPTIPNMRPYNYSDATPDFTFPVSSFSQPDDKHIVRLIVRDENYCVDTSEMWIKVYDIDVQALISDNQICNPTTVNFTDQTAHDTLITNWVWAATTAGTFATTQNSSYTFTNPPLDGVGGTYFVSLTVTDKLGCVEGNTFTISHYKPTSNINILDNTLCVGDSAFFTADLHSSPGTAQTYAWNFGNATSGNTRIDTTRYMTAGTFPVKLVYTEIATGCKDSTNASVFVQDYPVANFTTNKDGQPSICRRDALIFFTDASTQSASLPLSWLWNLGNGQSSAMQNVVQGYNKGTHTVSLEVSTSHGCKDSIARDFVVIGPEGNLLVAGNNPLCKGDSLLFTVKDTADVVSYTWDFGDGTFASDTSPVSHTYSFHPPTGTTTAQLVIVGEENCTDFAKYDVQIHAVIADFDRLTEVTNSDTSICLSENPYSFTNKSTLYDAYQWNFGDGITSSTQLNPAHTYASADTFQVSLSVIYTPLGCVDTMRKEVIVFANPTPVALSDTACLGGILHLTVDTISTANTYLWSPSTNLNYDTIASPTATVTIPTTFTVIETDTLTKCTGTDDVDGIVILPYDPADSDTTIIVGDYATLPVSKQPYYHFSWNPSDGLSCQDCNFPTTQPLENIVYTLTVTDDLGCFAPTSTHNITVRPETFIKFPTMFTPNGDGSNDIIHVRGWGIKELLEFKIFNRWGQLVYESTNLEEGWDGKFNGAYQNTDVYAYKIKVKTWREQELEQDGYFNLIR